MSRYGTTRNTVRFHLVLAGHHGIFLGTCGAAFWVVAVFVDMSIFLAFVASNWFL